jgi:hypothetical protein
MSQTNRNEVSAILREQLTEIEARIERRRNTLDGTPFVVRVAPHLYLQAANAEGRQRSGGIGPGAICYSRESAEERAAAARKAADFWANASVVHINDALADERAELARLIATIEAA